MPDRYSLEFSLTRDDWLAANSHLIATSPQYAEYAKAKQRAGIKQMLFLGPLIIGGASLAIGRMASTRGMYIEGAVAGAVLVGLMSLHYCRKSSHVNEARRQATDRVRRMELGDAAGRIVIEIDEQGVVVRRAGSESRTTWRHAVLHEAGGYFTLSTSHGGMVIPKAAIGDVPAVTAFHARCTEWWQTGQRSAVDRITAYVADRDVACPTCAYNLRGSASEKCPECGALLSVEALKKAKQ